MWVFFFFFRYLISLTWMTVTRNSYLTGGKKKKKKKKRGGGIVGWLVAQRPSNMTASWGFPRVESYQ